MLNITKLRPLSRRRVIDILKAHGFESVRWHGDHEQFKKKGEETKFTTVPNYPEIDVYLLKWIIKQTGIPREEFTS